jgi:predicted amidohydrolase YtcJ
LHDHHIHLFATAAAMRSAQCGPEAARDGQGLRVALEQQAPDARGWVRGVGYHESVAGDLDRGALDALLPDRPVRVQHRTGQLWMLNSRAIERLDLDRDASAPSGVERDAAGYATGRVYRCDAWLRARIGPDAPPSLADVSRRLAALGVTAVTDATADNGPAEVAAFAAARARGELSQRIVVMGTLELSEIRPPPGVAIGPVKIHLAEAELPDPDAVIAAIRAAHARRRNVAIHAVTRVELVFALAAYETAGVCAGDRLEHVHVAPPECIAAVARLGLTACVHPDLIEAQRASWLDDADGVDAPWLGRVDLLRDAGVALLAGSDAPHGPLVRTG